MFKWKINGKLNIYYFMPAILAIKGMKGAKFFAMLLLHNY